MHPKTIEAMNEVGIDVSAQRSKHVDELKETKFDYVITVCDRARQNCPILPANTPIHWGFDDPAEAVPERQLEMFRRVRDELTQRIRLFLLANRH